MKLLHTTLLKKTSFITAVLITVILFSCKPKSPACVITVKDKDGVTAMPGVQVDLFATVQTASGPQVADLRANGVTDKEGKIYFSFKNPCVMDIKATVSNCSSTYCSGAGIVKLEDGKTNQKTVYINN